MPGLGGTTNNYEILAQLASGGMAEIFLARVTAVAGVERHVVLKRILPAYKNDEEFVTMFLDEARLQAQLRHPNIAQLYDVGRLGSSYFYTMEYVHGETLASLAQKASARSEQVPIQHVLTLAAGVTSALHHAHTRVGQDRKPLHIVHRDVSPANVMITFDGVVKLLDFGVAKSRGRRMTETRAGIVKGKVAYLAPEQIGGKVLDGRCDLFSLGICLYELLTLHSLFGRDGDLDTLAAIVQEQVPPPSYFRKDVPPEIDALVMNALAKDPANRFASADVMHDAVEAAATNTKLSMSPSSLGRYLVKTFGQRPEPWLDFEALAPVTVMGDIIAPTEGVVVPKQLNDAAAALDVLIRNVPKVKLPADEIPPDDFADLEVTGKRLRITLPMASEHPRWESEVPRTPLPDGLDLGQLHPAATPSQPDQWNIPSVMERGGRNVMESGGRNIMESGGMMDSSMRRPLPGGGSLESMRPVAPRAETPNPSGTSWPKAKNREAPGTSWNVPRLVMAVAVVVAIVVAIIVAVS